MDKILALIASIIIGATIAEPVVTPWIMEVPDVSEAPEITEYIAEITPFIHLVDEYTPTPEPTPEPEPEEELEDVVEIEDEPTVSIAIQMLTPVQGLRYGADVELYCNVESDTPGYTISWEYSDDECETFHGLGWHLPLYVFKLTPENRKRYYRVVVSF